MPNGTVHRMETTSGRAVQSLEILFTTETVLVNYTTRPNLD